MDSLPLLPQPVSLLWWPFLIRSVSGRRLSLSLKYPIKGASFKCTPTTTERSSQRGGGGVKAGIVTKNGKKNSLKERQSFL